MTWLIVGGNGQLGKALSFVLSNRKINFCATGSIDLDIRSESLCNQFIGRLAPSVIINAAGWTDVDGAEFNYEGAHDLNVIGPLNLAFAAKRVKAVFTHISTDYVFSGDSNSPWRENDLRAPISVYGITKAAGEVAVLNEYAEGTYIIRTAWLYSQWGKNFAKTMTRLALSSNGDVRVVNDQVGQPTSAIDLANQIVDAVLAKLPFGIYHGTNSGQGSWFDFAHEIFKQCDSQIPDDRLVQIDSSFIDRPARRPLYSVLSHDSWAKTSVEPMRDWRTALTEAMPAIISTIQKEG
jgi:dTDP-4-dehydrorhamnose reductase